MESKFFAISTEKRKSSHPVLSQKAQEINLRLSTSPLPTFALLGKCGLIENQLVEAIKTFQKTFFGEKRDFVKMCQVRCPNQPLKVPSPQLRRSLNCGTFSPPKSHFRE